MREPVWFVVVTRHDRYGGEEQAPFYQLLRAHTWQDAYDTIAHKMREFRIPWGLYPLEKDGSYFEINCFVQIEERTLLQAGWEPKK